MLAVCVLILSLNLVSGALVSGIVADTGATVRVIGAVHRHLAQNERALVRSVLVDTAHGEVEVSREAGLPAPGMKGALILPDCESSLLPVVLVREELNLGFQISQGGSRARFYRDGRTVNGLCKEGRLFIEPIGSLVEPDSGYDTCEEGEQWHWDGLDGVQLVIGSDREYIRDSEGIVEVVAVAAESNVVSEAACEGESVTLVESHLPQQPLPAEHTAVDSVAGLVSQLGEQLAPHERVLCAARTTELALVADTLTDPKLLLQHQLDGRRDGRKCPHCIQAGMWE